MMLSNRLIAIISLLAMLGCSDDGSRPPRWEVHRLPYSPPHGFFGHQGVIELVPVYDTSGDPATDALLQALSDGGEFELTIEAGPYPNEIPYSDKTSTTSSGEVHYSFFEWDRPIAEGQMRECTFRITAEQVEELRRLLVEDGLLRIESYWTGKTLDSTYVVCTIRCGDEEHQITGDGTMPTEMIDLYDWICLNVYSPHEADILDAPPVTPRSSDRDRDRR